MQGTRRMAKPGTRTDSTSRLKLLLRMDGLHNILIIRMRCIRVMISGKVGMASM